MSMPDNRGGASFVSLLGKLGVAKDFVSLIFKLFLQSKSVTHCTLIFLETSFM